MRQVYPGPIVITITNMEGPVDTALEPISGIGHNSGDVVVTIRTKLFNSVIPPGSGPRLHDLTFSVGATLDDLVRELDINPAAIFIAWANGRDVTKRLGDNINLEYVLTDGDEIALSGPIPYSWGYGSPVV
jgi:hypothetical protein